VVVTAVFFSYYHVYGLNLLSVGTFHGVCFATL